MKEMMMVLMLAMVFSGCAETKWNSKLQNEYFNKDGKKAGYSASQACIKQAMKETGRSYWVQFCGNDAKCRELAEICMIEHGYTRPATPETSAERMALYKKAYEEEWIKVGMTKKEVLDLLGVPQIITYQLIPPRKIWEYCRSATKTVLIGFNFVLTIVWKDDKVESITNRFIL